MSVSVSQASESRRFLSLSVMCCFICRATGLAFGILLAVGGLGACGALLAVGGLVCRAGLACGILLAACVGGLGCGAGLACGSLLAVAASECDCRAGLMGDKDNFVWKKGWIILGL